MATFTAVNNGNGTVTLQVRGVADSATQVQIGFGTWAYNNVSLDVLDDGPSSGGVTNNYSCTFKTAAGGTIGTLTASAVATWPAPSASWLGSGPYTGVSWSNSDDGNTYTTFSGTDLYYNVNNTGWTHYGFINGAMGGNITATAVYVGYSTSVQWAVYTNWTDTRNGTTIQPETTVSGTTGPAPPPAPNPATGATITSDDDANTIALTWTASVGGASGYYVYRTQPSGSRTYVNSTTGTSYTDTAAGVNRPVTYDILAYNSGAGGTTTASSYSTVISKSRVTAQNQTVWTDNGLASKARQALWMSLAVVADFLNSLWIVYNARLTPDGAPASSGITGSLTDIADDPANPDANWALGSGGPQDTRVTFPNPDSIHMSNPTGTQQFRILVRT